MILVRWTSAAVHFGLPASEEGQGKEREGSATMPRHNYSQLLRNECVAVAMKFSRVCDSVAFHWRSSLNI